MTHPLADWLEENSKSMKDLAFDLGIHRSVPSHWIAGRRRPSRVHAITMERMTEGRVPASIWGLDSMTSPGAALLYEWMSATGLRGEAVADLLDVSSRLYRDTLRDIRVSPVVVARLRERGPPIFRSIRENHFNV